MSDTNKSYRIKYNEGQENYLNIKLDRDFDFLEVLSLNIRQEDVYKTYVSNYGVIIGRALANDGFGIPNAKISVFISNENVDRSSAEGILYPYKTASSVNADGVRYNLLSSNNSSNKCHQNIGTIPNKRSVLDNDINVEIFDKYYKYTTTTNESGDYMLFGVPTGQQMIHVDIDLSDIGVLSQTPRDMTYKGYNLKQFENPNKFKKSKDLNGLAQIISQDASVYVYPFWGDETQTDIAITKKDINISYKFEPTCVFMGSIFTDSPKSYVSKNCKPSKTLGKMSELVASQGSIEMIRETIDGKIERLDINGGRVIDGNGVWCYQIPMNLDYVITDEYGNLVPTVDITKGIPTRANVRFRITLDDNGDEYVQSNTGVYLIPNNPNNPNEEDYNFNITTKNTSFVNLLWNKVYSVKNYIPRIQKTSSNETSRRFIGLKSINFHENNNPTPYNNIWINLNLRFMLICFLSTFIVNLVGIINKYIIGPLKNVAWTSNAINNISPITINIETMGNDVAECIRGVIVGGDDVYFLVPQFKGGLNDELSTRAKSMSIIYSIGELNNKDYIITNKNNNQCFPNYDAIGTGTTNGMFNIQITESGILIGCSNDPLLAPYLNMGTVEKTSGIYKWYAFKESTVTFEATGREPNLTRIINNCIETQLSTENEVVNFDFNNDWLNGSLYAPRFYTKTKRSRKNGVKTIKYCGSKINHSLELMQTCAPIIDSNGTPTTGNTECTDQTKWSDCYKKHITKSITSGILNRYDETYYYKSNTFDGNTPIHLLSTNIVLLGSLNDCDIDGIPQLHQLLPSTTFKLPPESKDVDDDMSGIDWGEDTNKTDSDYSYRNNGLFVGIGCMDSDTKLKSCVNASRLCELGVDFDEEYTYVNSSGVEITVPSDGYIALSEISDGDARAMFSTLNMNNLSVVNNQYNHKKYNFSYKYPDGFDGRLKTHLTNTGDAISNDYVSFRKSNTPYSYTANQFHRFENSFYFYFGIKPGSTAIDIFNTQYFVPCVDNIEEKIKMVLRVITNENCNGVKGKIGIALDKFSPPCSLYVNGLFERTITTIPPTDITIDNLTKGNYIVKAVDSDGNSVSKSINVPFTSCHIYTGELNNWILEEEYRLEYTYTGQFNNYVDEEIDKINYIPFYTYTGELNNWILEEEYRLEYTYTGQFNNYVDEEIDTQVYIPFYTYTGELNNWILEEEYRLEYTYTGQFNNYVDEEIPIPELSVRVSSNESYGDGEMASIGITVTNYSKPCKIYINGVLEKENVETESEIIFNSLINNPHRLILTENNDNGDKLLMENNDLTSFENNMLNGTYTVTIVDIYNQQKIQSIVVPYIPYYTYTGELNNWILEEEYRLEYTYTGQFNNYIDEEILI